MDFCKLMMYVYKYVRIIDNIRTTFKFTHNVDDNTTFLFPVSVVL